MRDLAIAYGNSRQAKKWSNKTVKFDDLKKRLQSTMYTTESVEEYKKMSKAQRDAAKDHGGFVAGVLKGGRLQGREDRYDSHQVDKQIRTEHG